jgi:hypothetical protein
MPTFESPGRTALIGVGISEDQPLFCEAIDVGRLVAHHAFRKGADVGDTDVVTPDDDDIRLLVRSVCAGGHENP